MIFIQHYKSPIGGILLAADEIGLTGLWFDGQKYFARSLPNERTETETPVLLAAKHWLDIYFAGKKPDLLPPLHPIGSAFRRSVWDILLQIPYGQTTTYGLQKSRVFPECLLRRSAVRLGITKYLSLFHATGLSAQTAV